MLIQARLSRQLTELEAQVPLTVDLDALHPGPPDREALRRLFVELEFSKLTKELGFDQPIRGDRIPGTGAPRTWTGWSRPSAGRAKWAWASS